MKRGNGDGSIFKLSGNRRNPWAVRITVGWTPEGKQKIKYLGYYRTKTDAKNALREYQAKPYDLEKKNVTLSDMYAEWIKLTTLSKNTLKQYASGYNKCAVLHSKPIREIKVAQVELILYDNPTSMQPIIKNMLNNLFEHALKNEILEKNIVPLVKVQKHTKKRNKIPLSKEQIEKVLAYNDHHYADIVRLLLYTGMRITELFDIRLKDVNIEERYMVGGKKTENGIDRIIPIHNDIFETVTDLHKRNRKYLVETEDGRQIEYKPFYDEFWTKYKEELELTQTPHDLRHTLVTYATKQGIDRAALQKIVGHKSDSITDHYTHRTPAELLKEINKLKYI